MWYNMRVSNDAEIAGIAVLLDRAERECEAAFRERERIEAACFRRVLDAFRRCRVSAADFTGSTGYGYNDRGRENLERVFAYALECEDALVRPQIVSGTHAISLALFGLLNNGDGILSVTGKPYDTLDAVIGIGGRRANRGSLAASGVRYERVELLDSGEPDLEMIERALLADRNIRVVYIQRSRGYAWRSSLSPDQIGEAASLAHSVDPSIIVMVDNCYGEFTREHEPSYSGADVLAGSLIKNAGGGLAPTGGYIAGRRDLVERVAERLTCPGIGREVGSYESGYRLYYQGLFAAPHAVCQACQAGIMTARAFGSLGFRVNPSWDDARNDIVQTVRLGDPSLVRRVCEAVQACSPVDSYAAPVPDDMPGYADPIIMAAGTFVSGSSIELSADAPMREPYDLFIQGGLTRAHARVMLEAALPIAMSHAKRPHQHVKG
jgi:cystathionine beta-lyase family protein involved in aluminum resistance